MAVTTTLFNIIRSELIKRGLDEYQDADGNLLFFEEDAQFWKKVLVFDSDVSSIISDLFADEGLADPAHDTHFKRAFTLRFANREINRQTVEAFRLELLSTFLVNRRYIQSIYADMDKYILGEQTTDQANTQRTIQMQQDESTSDNRSAFANLPQNRVNLDVDNTVMTSANDNTVTRTKNRSNGNSTNTADGETETVNRAYRLEELFKSNGAESRIFDEFDRKCFLQVW